MFHSTEGCMVTSLCTHLSYALLNSHCLTVFALFCLQTVQIMVGAITFLIGIVMAVGELSFGGASGIFFWGSIIVSALIPFVPFWSSLCSTSVDFSSLLKFCCVTVETMN